MSESQANFFTSESVSEGHPDKMADQISDAIVQYVVSRDPKARVAVETVVKGVTEGPNAGSYVILAGELTTDVDVPFEEIVRKTINAIGYDNDEIGYNGNTVQFTNLIGQQSPDINMGVDRADGELGAGDQGIMFGIACDETAERFPLAITMSHKLLAVLSHDRKSKTALGVHLRPDAKSQVTLAYDDNGQVVGIDTIVISVQHDEQISLQELREGVIREIITPVVAEFGYGESALVDVLGAPVDVASGTPIIKCLVNPTGNFVIGGPVGDCGLTGRKIIVDTSGGYGRHGGGAFSGKDPSKVDRSAAYAARWAARNIVAAGLAKKAEIQLSYAIGYAKPTSIRVDTFGTAAAGLTEKQIAAAVGQVFDFSPAGILRDLQLTDPNGAGFNYEDTASYGHFGRSDANFPWEKENRVAALRDAVQGAA